MALGDDKIITLGLSEIQVGVASTAGEMPVSLAKIGKTYKDTCKLDQATSDVTEHFEEGMSAPEVRKKTKKIPVLTFSVMDCNVQTLVDYIGGEDIGEVGSPIWGFNGDELVENKAIRVKTEQGLWIDIPNADIEAIVKSDFSSKGIFLVEFTVTPMAVTAGKALLAYAAPAV